MGSSTVITGAEWLESPGSLGRQTAMTELRIVDDDGDEVPAPDSRARSISGRCIGSDFEYHNDPEKTAAAHLEDGWGTLGDIGYLDEDGYLFMSDRKIDMIISGGVNIYPAEIEGVLVGHPAVQDAAVFGIPDDEMGEQVKAVVELCPGVEPSDALAAELVALCRESLAGYKAPRRSTSSSVLPRHPTGKLFKRLLPRPVLGELGRTI